MVLELQTSPCWWNTAFSVFSVWYLHHPVGKLFIILLVCFNSVRMFAQVCNQNENDNMWLVDSLYRSHCTLFFSSLESRKFIIYFSSPVIFLRRLWVGNKEKKDQITWLGMKWVGVGLCQWVCCTSFHQNVKPLFLTPSAQQQVFMRSLLSSAKVWNVGCCAPNSMLHITPLVLWYCLY